jgi:hypothetical protein
MIKANSSLSLLVLGDSGEDGGVIFWVHEPETSRVVRSNILQFPLRLLLLCARAGGVCLAHNALCSLRGQIFSLSRAHYVFMPRAAHSVTWRRVRLIGSFAPPPGRALQKLFISKIKRTHKHHCLDAIRPACQL